MNAIATTAETRRRAPGEMIAAGWIFVAIGAMLLSAAAAYLLDAATTGDCFPAQMATLGLGFLGCGAAMQRAIRPALVEMKTRLGRSVAVPAEVVRVERAGRGKPRVTSVRFTDANGAVREQPILGGAGRPPGASIVVRYDAADPTWAVADIRDSTDLRLLQGFSVLPAATGVLCVVGGLLLML